MRSLLFKYKYCRYISQTHVCLLKLFFFFAFFSPLILCVFLPLLSFLSFCSFLHSFLFPIFLPCFIFSFPSSFLPFLLLPTPFSINRKLEVRKRVEREQRVIEALSKPHVIMKEVCEPPCMAVPLWCRGWRSCCGCGCGVGPAAVALIGPLAWESPYASGAALNSWKKKRKKKKKKKKKGKALPQRSTQSFPRWGTQGSGEASRERGGRLLYRQADASVVPTRRMSV